MEVSGVLTAEHEAAGLYLLEDGLFLFLKDRHTTAPHAAVFSAVSALQNNIRSVADEYLCQLQVGDRR